MASLENNVADQIIKSTSKSLTKDNDTIVNPVSEKLENDDQFQIGDIVWAKLGGYPFWPSIVCLDPESKTYIRESPGGGKKTFSVHVRFCSDKGRRSWANEVKKYFGKDEFLLKHPNGMSGFKLNKRLEKQWSKAIQEADRWLTIARKGRLIQFFKVNFLQMDVLPTNIAEKLDAESTYYAPSTSKIATEKLDMKSTYCAPSTSKIATDISDAKHASNNKYAKKLKNTTLTSSGKTGDKKPKSYNRKNKAFIIRSESDDDDDDDDDDDNIDFMPNTVKDDEDEPGLKQSTLRANRKRLQEIQLLESRDPDCSCRPIKTPKCR